MVKIYLMEQFGWTEREYYEENTLATLQQAMEYFRLRAEKEKLDSDNKSISVGNRVVKNIIRR